MTKEIAIGQNPDLGNRKENSIKQEYSAFIRRVLARSTQLGIAATLLVTAACQKVSAGSPIPDSEPTNRITTTYTPEPSAAATESPTLLVTPSETPDTRTSLEYSENFVPAWYERSIGVSDGLEIPITIGLMDDVVNNATYPIKEIHMTQKGADAVASRFLHSAWGRYRDLMDHPDVTYEQYIELVKKGEGNIEILVIWEEGVRKIASIDPREGFSLVVTDEEEMETTIGNFGIDRPDGTHITYSSGFYATADERGRLLFVTNNFEPIKFATDEFRSDKRFVFSRSTGALMGVLMGFVGWYPNRCLAASMMTKECAMMPAPEDATGPDGWGAVLGKGISDYLDGESEDPLFIWVR